MSTQQYKAYCRIFGLKLSISPSTGRTVKGTRGKKGSAGTTLIPIPFKGIKLVIDVAFFLLTDDVPTLLSTRDMLRNGLNISIQHAHIMHGGMRQDLKVENYFLMHERKPDEMPYAL